jgi:hypothetical protein
VQMVRRECALGSQQLAWRRLPWRAPRLIRIELPLPVLQGMQAVTMFDQEV